MPQECIDTNVSNSSERSAHEKIGLGYALTILGSILGRLAMCTLTSYISILILKLEIRSHNQNLSRSFFDSRKDMQSKC